MLLQMSCALTVCFSGSRLVKNNKPLHSSKVSGSTIISGVHCLVHDVNIRLLTYQFGRLFIVGVVMPVNQSLGANDK